MAIDTAAKRRSVSGLPHHPLGPGVTPNAAKNAAWRQQSGWGYSGIPAANPTPPPPSDGEFTVSGRDVRALFLFENVTAPYSPVSKRTN